MQEALRAYAQANIGQLPASLDQLQPCRASPLDGAILDRWEIADRCLVPNVNVGDTVITQKPPVDDVLDSRQVFSLTGGHGSTDFLSESTREVMRPVYDAYHAANPGPSPSDVSQLLPCATTPEQQAALQKIILKASVPQQN